ncbi:MAG: alanine--tRNA ligase [bacterium]
MEPTQLRDKFLEFFAKVEHKIIPSSSLIPDDSSVLLTTAGMQQFVPYLSGQVEPPYKRACSVQKCFRTGDIEEVGDDTHHTFFEMLGNWSFGDYFKKEAIVWALDFLTNVCKLDKNKLYVSIFEGKGNIPGDEEAREIWQENGIPKERIFAFGMKDNFWGPTAETGPCGPCSEIHYDRGKDFAIRDCSIEGCGPNCNCGRFVEIWNLVFMEYNKNETGDYQLLKQKNIDTGIGFERLTAILQKKHSAYDTELFWPLIQELEKQSSQKYNDNKTNFRVIADHIRGASFLIADGILPGNLDRGYILRRIIRRAIRYAKFLNLAENWYLPLVEIVANLYGDAYPEIKGKKADIITVIQGEEDKFGRALEKGLDELEKLKTEDKKLKAKDAFYIYQTFGFPLEMIQEELNKKGITVSQTEFNEEFKKHQDISRAGAEKKFCGVGIKNAKSAEEIEKLTKLHTATHLLHASLRQILGEHVKQMGSDISFERLRFDFSHPQKMTAEEIQKIETLINKKIAENLEVKKEEMSYQEAIDSGALAFFKEKYPAIVNVYSIEGFSKEICAGPHIDQTGKLGLFKVVKEESSGAGVRRIKAILE